MMSALAVASAYALSQGLGCCSASARPAIRGAEHAASDATRALAHTKTQARLTVDKAKGKNGERVCMKH
ncbi:hypothetical protein [Bifidobacterium pseudocatenulatum]|uniref:hypothetical protein n=1 Tax=Bifidobacterium pseudocatenulatum TaxID=28026 RepID=UPI000968352A|nr:hypothetical protein [Bifidobacterium pseudocatenulatum]OKY87915.1 MAG: hypothetical protein BHV59_06905 [Bifidobacterium sp. 56_9_plus]